MGHGHHHHDHHHHGVQEYGRAFAIGIALNTVYFLVEMLSGLFIGSSALVADAAHNASDVLSLVLAWFAIWLASRKSSHKYTYGMRRSTILASLVNGILIVIAAGWILWEAIEKFQNPVAIPGRIVLVVASVGLVVNTGTALMFMKGQKEDLNIRGAFLHMAADALVTLGVLIGGIVMMYSDAYWVDPVLSIIIVGVILWSAWGLLKDSVELVLDAVPREIDYKDVETYLNDIPGVEDVHDLHIWALSTSDTAMTVHLVIPSGQTDQFIYDLRRELHDRFGIEHVTVQIEKEFEDEEYRHCVH